MKKEDVRLMTLDEAIILSLSTHPSIFTDSSWNKVKFNVIEFLFNTIGTGISTPYDFKIEYSLTEKNKKLMIDNYEKYITKEPLYYCFKKSKDDKYFGDEYPGIYNESELSNLTDLDKKIVLNQKIVENPEKYKDLYPNFKKEYSFIWNNQQYFKNLDSSWLEGTLMFYNQCKEYFLSETSHEYHFACPAENDENAWNKELEKWEKTLSKYFETDKPVLDSYKKISDDYGFPYDGDIKKFLQGKWNKEKTRILEFIDETINVINNELKNKNQSVSIKKKM